MFFPLGQRVPFMALALAFKLLRGAFTLSLGPPESNSVFLGLRLRRTASFRLALTMKIDHVAQLLPSKERLVPPKTRRHHHTSCATPRVEA
ncbi:hypothetical protein QOZ94_000751 [Xanthobacter agilis]|uniref:Secreted protein n=1 Tax=Xanthobacter agilis TaxID=47492 RepID=A0ABU0LA10_XANAG|nr:hypothetical protein [Xanthobacter agilis]